MAERKTGKKTHYGNLWGQRAPKEPDGAGAIKEGSAKAIT